MPSLALIQKTFDGIPVISQLTRSGGTFQTSSTSFVDITSVSGFPTSLAPLEYATMRGSMNVRSTDSYHQGTVRLVETTTGNSNILINCVMALPYNYGSGIVMSGVYGAFPADGRNNTGVTLTSFKLQCSNNYNSNLMNVFFNGTNDNYIVQGKYIMPSTFTNSASYKWYIGVKQYIDQVKIVAVRNWQPAGNYGNANTMNNLTVYNNPISTDSLFTISVQGIDPNGLTIMNDQVSGGTVSAFYDWSGYKMTVTP